MSEELNLSIVLKATDKGMVGTIRGSEEELSRLAGQTDKTRRSNDRFNKSLQTTDRRATLAGKALRRAGAAMGAYFSAQALLGMVKQADQWNVLQQRIRTATKETGDYVEVSRRLYEITRDNGAAMEGSVSLFQSISRARAELDATNDDALTLTDTIQKLGVIGGSSGAAMQAGMLQFSQMLAGGVARAEEMNSLFENMPEVAARIAKGLGMTQGELRQAVLEGRVLSRDVFQALLKQAGEIRQEFENIPVSVERASSALGQSFTRLLASFDQELGLTDKLARAMQSVAESIDEYASDKERMASPVAQLNQELATLYRRLEEKPNQGWLHDWVHGDADEIQQRINDIYQELADLNGLYPDTIDGFQEWIEASDDLDEVIEQMERYDIAVQSTGRSVAAATPAIIDYNAAMQEGKALLEDLMTPQERYEAQLDRLFDLYAAGAINLETFNRAQARYRKELDDATGATNRLVAAQRKLQELKSKGGALLDSLFPEEAEYNRYMENMALIGKLREQGVIDAEREQEALERLRESYYGVDGAIEEVSRTAAGASQTMAELVGNTGELAKQNVDGFKEMRQAVEGWGRSFADTMLDSEKSFAGFAESVINQMARILMAKAMDPVFNAFGDWVDGLFNPTAAVDWSAGAGWVGGVFHGGGVVGTEAAATRVVPASIFANAPRHHTGYIAPNERAAILRKDESVLTPGQMKQLGGSTINYTYAPQIDARGADPGVDARIRAVSRQEADRALAQFQREINRGGAAAKLVGRRR